MPYDDMSPATSDPTAGSLDLTTVAQANAAVKDLSAMQQALALLGTLDTAELKKLRDEANKKLSRVCYFLDVLPEELRVQIYEYVLIGENGSYRHAGARKTRADPGSPERIIIDRYHFRQPGLLATCKEIRAVASPIYYDKNKFLVDCQQLDPTAIMSFSQHALSGASKPFAMDVAIDMGDVNLETEWLMRWARAHYEGAVIRWPKAAAPSETDDDRGADEHGFIGSLFNIVTKGKKRGNTWADIEEDINEIFGGSLYIYGW